MEKELQGLEARLANKAFVDKAPQKVGEEPACAPGGAAQGGAAGGSAPCLGMPPHGHLQRCCAVR